MAPVPSSHPRRRISDMLAAIERIESYLDDGGGVTAVLAESRLHKDAIERQLLVIAEAAGKVLDIAAPLEPDIDWHAIRGMGNVIRHAYDKIDDAVLQHVLTQELVPLRHACARLLDHLPDNGA